MTTAVGLLPEPTLVLALHARDLLAIAAVLLVWAAFRRMRRPRPPRRPPEGSGAGQDDRR